MSRPYTIKPEDIRAQEFRGKMRGYDPVQVRSYLEEIAEQVQGLQREATDLRKRLVAAEQSASHATSSSVDSTDSAWRTPANPDIQAEAKAILDRAKAEARNYEDEARAQLSDLTRQVEELKALRTRLVSQIETLLNSQLEHLDRIKGGMDDDEPPAPEAPPVMASISDNTQV